MSEENADYWNKVFVETSKKIDELIATMWAALDDRINHADLPAVYGYMAGRTDEQAHVLGRFVVLHAALRNADLHIKKAKAMLQ
jgi:hypothetical protein